MPVNLHGAHGIRLGGANERVHLDMDAIDDFSMRDLNRVTLRVLRAECESGSVGRSETDTIHTRNNAKQEKYVPINFGTGRDVVRKPSNSTTGNNLFNKMR